MRWDFMDFAFSSEQQLLQSTMRDFARRELLPLYQSRDRDEDLPPALVRKLGELGVLAPMADPGHGGAGLDTFRWELRTKKLRAATSMPPTFCCWPPWSARSWRATATIVRRLSFFHPSAAEKSSRRSP